MMAEKYATCLQILKKMQERKTKVYPFELLQAIEYNLQVKQKTALEYVHSLERLGLINTNGMGVEITEKGKVYH